MRADNPLMLEGFPMSWLLFVAMSCHFDTAIRHSEDEALRQFNRLRPNGYDVDTGLVRAEVATALRTRKRLRPITQTDCPEIDNSRFALNSIIQSLRGWGVTVQSTTRGGREEIEVIEVVEGEVRSENMTKVASMLPKVICPKFSMAYISPDDQFVEALSRMAGLEEVFFFNVVLESRGLRWFRNANKLKRLTISFSQICSLRELRADGLLELDASYDDLGDNGLIGISANSMLSKLNLAGNQKLTDRAVAEVAKCTKLKSLSLWNTQMSEAGFAKLDRLRELEHLDVGATELTDASFERLCRLESLMTIEIRGTRISKEAIAKIMKVRPSLKIVQ